MRKVIVKGIYKHFKGNLYMVEDIGYDSSTLEKCVIYRALYEDRKLYIRKYSEFISLVDKNKYPNIKQKYRFKLERIKSKI